MARVRDEYESWRAHRADLVYGALTPFGLTGPMADWFGGDVNAQSLSGWAAVAGDADRAPLTVGYGICEMQHGLTAAAAIIAAILQPSASELVDVSEAAVLAADIRMYSASYTAYRNRDGAQRAAGSRLDRALPAHRAPLRRRARLDHLPVRARMESTGGDDRIAGVGLRPRY